MAFTAYALALAIRGGLHPGHSKSPWPMPPSPLFHGWPLIAVNVCIYCWMCWLAFWLIRGTMGRERIFMVGWFVDILTWPLKMLRPDWVVAVRHIAALGLAVALLAALTLILDPPDVADISGRADSTQTEANGESPLHDGD